MNEFYQLILTQDKSFQDKLDHLLARLTKVDGVRLSKRRLVHAGVISLRNANIKEITSYDNQLIMVNGKNKPNFPPKHAAIQMDRVYADLARLKSAHIAVKHGFRRTTRDYVHYGLTSLSEATQQQFETLVRASILIEKEGEKIDTSQYVK